MSDSIFSTPAQGPSDDLRDDLYGDASLSDRERVTELVTEDLHGRERPEGVPTLAESEVLENTETVPAEDSEAHSEDTVVQDAASAATESTGHLGFGGSLLVGLEEDESELSDQDSSSEDVEVSEDLDLGFPAADDDDDYYDPTETGDDDAGDGVFRVPHDSGVDTGEEVFGEVDDSFTFADRPLTRESDEHSEFADRVNNDDDFDGVLTPVPVSPVTHAAPSPEPVQPQPEPSVPADGFLSGASDSGFVEAPAPAAPHAPVSPVTPPAPSTPAPAPAPAPAAQYLPPSARQETAAPTPAAPAAVPADDPKKQLALMVLAGIGAATILAVILAIIYNIIN